MVTGLVSIFNTAEASVGNLFSIFERMYIIIDYEVLEALTLSGEWSALITKVPQYQILCKRRLLENYLLKSSFVCIYNLAYINK